MKPMSEWPWRRAGMRAAGPWRPSRQRAALLRTIAAKRVCVTPAGTPPSAGDICAWLLEPIRSGMWAWLSCGSVAGTSGAEGSSRPSSEPGVTVTFRTAPCAHGLRRTTCQYQRPGARD